MTAYAKEQSRLYALGWVQTFPETRDQLISFGFEQYGDPKWHAIWEIAMGPLFAAHLVYIMDDQTQSNRLRLRRIKAIAADSELEAALYAAWLSVPSPELIPSTERAAAIEKLREIAVERYLDYIPGLRRTVHEDERW